MVGGFDLGEAALAGDGPRAGGRGRTAEGQQTAAAKAEGRVPCPSCAEMILPNAKLYRICNSPVPAGAVPVDDGVR